MRSFGILVAVGFACARADGVAEVRQVSEVSVTLGEEPATPQVHGTKIHRVSPQLDKASKVSKIAAKPATGAAATESRGGVSREAPYPAEQQSSDTLFTLLRLAGMAAAIVVVFRHTTWGRAKAEKLGPIMSPLSQALKDKGIDKGIDQVFDICQRATTDLVKQASAIVRYANGMNGMGPDDAETELRQPLTSSFSDAGSDCDPAEAEQVYDQHYFRRAREIPDDADDEPTDDIRILPSTAAPAAAGMHIPQEPAFDPDEFASSAPDPCNPCLNNPWGQTGTRGLGGDLEDFLDDVEDDLGEHREAMAFPVQHLVPPAEPPQQQPTLGFAETATEAETAEEEVPAAKARLDTAMANAKAAAEGQSLGGGAKMHEVLTTGPSAAAPGPAVGLDALDTEATAVQFEKVSTSFFDDDDDEVDPMI